MQRRSILGGGIIMREEGVDSVVEVMEDREGLLGVGGLGRGLEVILGGKMKKTMT